MNKVVRSEVSTQRTCFETLHYFFLEFFTFDTDCWLGKFVSSNVYDANKRGHNDTPRQGMHPMICVLWTSSVSPPGEISEQRS
ncbi:hypothetical protein FKM82_002332 [Ascaphus truei]